MMTEQEFLALELRERDALVAEKVMGWKRHVVSNFSWQMVPPDHEGPVKVFGVPYFTTGIISAWQVVEKMHEGDYEFMMEWDAEDKEWFVSVHKYDPATTFSAPVSVAHHEVFPTAATIAALKAVGEIE